MRERGITTTDSPEEAAGSDLRPGVRLSAALVERLAMLAVAASWLPFILVTQSEVIGGSRYWWLGDDAMISMRYARNLAAGSGLVWNAGERVEGFSNFLWTLYMAVPHLLRVPARATSLVILLTNLAIGTLTLPVLARLVRRLGGGLLAVTGTLAAYALSRNVAYWATTGFETPLLNLLLLWALHRILAARDSPRLSTFLVIGGIALVRADGLVLSGLLVLLALALSEDRRRTLAGAAIALGLPLLYEAFRLLYYADFLPNTARLKATNWEGRYLAGFLYARAFLLRYGVPMVLAVACAVRSRDRRTRLLFVGTVLYVLYVAYVGGDAFPEFRFFVPVIPIVLAMAFLGIEQLPIHMRWRIAAALACFLTVPSLAPGYVRAVRQPNRFEYGSVELGLLLKKNTSPGSRVADTAAGTIFYFSDRYGIDLLGKTDRHIARLPAHAESNRPGHNKFDFAYSLGARRADYVVTWFRFPAGSALTGAEIESVMRPRAKGQDAWAALLVLDPTFQQHFLPNPVRVDSPRTIFVADWSPDAARRDAWRPVTDD